MTTAHRPTFDPARGKEALRGPGFHQRLLPAYTKLKYRQPGQLADDDAIDSHDMRAELLAAEAAHFAKTGRGKRGNALTSPEDADEDNEEIRASLKRAAAVEKEDEGEEDVETKRRRVLEESRHVDADSDDNEEGSDDSEEDEDSDDSDDSEAELQRELERVRKEKAEKKAREERERAKEEEDEKAKQVAVGNPLLNKPDYSIKRRWNDDVVFKNQARGTEDKKKEFVNDMLRSDFHRRFMSKYVR